MNPNEIEVHDFVDLSKETMRAIEIENAKQLLKRNGYYVGNLWQTCDVTMNYDCTEEQAQEVLDGVLTDDYISQQIFEGITMYADNLKLKEI